MRKILSGLLVLAMLLSVFSVTAYAAGSSGTVEAAVSAEGSAVTVTLKAAQDTVSGRLTVDYDASRLTYVETKVSGQVTSLDQKEGSVTFGYAAASDQKIAKGAIIATLRLQAKSGQGLAAIAVTVEDFNQSEGIHEALPGLTVPTGLPFTDVPEKSWYYPAVEYVYSQGLFKGTTATTFSPKREMTRAMFVTVLGRMAGVEEDRTVESKFVDVKTGSYYACYVAWAEERGIVLGTSQTTFSPNAKVTREQMAAMMYRYAKARGLDVTGGSEDVLDGFADSGRISGWAKEAMIWAVSRKLLQGTGAGLEPRAYGTRAQSAQIILNFSLYAN